MFQLIVVEVPMVPIARNLQELVRDKGRRVHDLSYEGLTHILWAGQTQWMWMWRWWRCSQ